MMLMFLLVNLLPIDVVVVVAVVDIVADVFVPHTQPSLPVLMHISFAAGGFGCYHTYDALPLFVATRYVFF